MFERIYNIYFIYMSLEPFDFKGSGVDRVSLNGRYVDIPLLILAAFM